MNNRDSGYGTHNQTGSIYIRWCAPSMVALAVAALLYSPSGVRAQNAPQQAPGTATPTGGLEEIVVTATRREESIQDVPISIQAFSQEQMDIQGVRSVDDIARLTPGVQFQRGNGGFGSDLASSISIRGIASAAGPATTGVYIDDTPIQVGSVIASGNFADNAYPQLFDVERVEVLRGPQGTLFGSGSEGGTVRFVTPAPNLTTSSVYVRSEAAYTEYGAPSYEFGAAGGMPIIPDVLGFRASLWTRQDGGYIDKADWYTGTVTEPNANWTDSMSARLALGWQPFDGLMITPSIFYQHIHANENNTFYLHSDGVNGTNPYDGQPLQPFVNTLGNVGNGDYVDLHNVHQYGDQRLALPALKIDYKFSNMELLSNTSYYDREQTGQTDFQSLEVGFWAGKVFPNNPLDLTPGYDSQPDHFFTQEVRLQSTDNDSRLKWLVGAYYSRDITNANRLVYDPYLGSLIYEGPFGQAGFCNSPQNCLQGILGFPLSPGGYSFVGNTQTVETQKAVFAQADFKITDQLIATVGVRHAEFNNDWQNQVGGPVNGVSVPALQTGVSSASSTTPKYMVSYKPQEGVMVYASASKGFRDGGVNAPVGNNVACGPPLAQLGLKEAPTTYQPDSVWSYELGTKFTTDERRLIVDLSVFQIKWSNQINNVSLTQCTLSFTGNLGTVQSRGADLSVQWRALDPLVLGLNAGYQLVKSTQSLVANPTGGPGGGPLYFAFNGETLLGSAPTVNLSGQFNFKAFGNTSYARADFTYQGQDSGQSPNSSTYSSNIVGWTQYATEFRNPSTRQTNARIGTIINNWDVSLFANNLFNSQPILNETRGTVTLDSQPTGELTANTLRPRTVGVTGIFRF